MKRKKEYFWELKNAYMYQPDTQQGYTKLYKISNVANITNFQHIQLFVFKMVTCPLATFHFKTTDRLLFMIV